MADDSDGGRQARAPGVAQLSASRPAGFRRVRVGDGAKIAALVGVCALYFAGLGWSPPYLSIEEVATVQQAVTLAATGRDDSGRFLPLYITEAGTDPDGGRDPIWVYVDAALLRIAPFSEARMRVFSALVGVADIVLLFLVGRRLFRNEALAWAAAAILALTPAHFMHSRIGTQQIGPVPFVLVWLLFLIRYLEARRLRDLVSASAALGLGTYSYTAAIVLLPCFFLAMLAVLVRCRPLEQVPAGSVLLRRELSWAVAGFCVPLVPMLAWHLVHPERLGQMVDYYTHHGYNKDVADSGILSSRWAVARLDLWWNTLNPERLLFMGDSDLRYSTRQVGHLLLPVGILMAIGMVRLRQFMPAELRLVTALVLLLGPVPAIFAGDPFIKRWLPLLPFLALLAAVGIAVLLEAPRRVWRGFAVGLVAAATIQFADFLRYYHSEYRAASNFYFQGNVRDTVREVLAVTDSPACALVDQRLQVEAGWRLYMRLAGRDEFAERWNAVDVQRPDFSPPVSCLRSSVVVLEGQLRDNPEARRRLEATGWQKTSIPEPEGNTIYAVYRHTAG